MRKPLPPVIFPPDNSRRKTWPTLVIFDSDYDYVEVSPWKIEDVEDAIIRLTDPD